MSLPGFADDVKLAIAERGVKVPALDVQVEVKVEAAASPYRVSYQRSAAPSPKTALPRPQARLVVLQGQTDVKELTIDRDLLYIGRLKDVMNSKTGLERQNQLAFDAAEATVSRKHARLEYDPDSGKFRLFNDPEQTSISRDGRGIPCDATRGLQLRSGDELILGKPGSASSSLTDLRLSLDAHVQAHIEAHIEAHMERHKIPGLSVAILRQGTLVHAEGYGLANLDHQARATVDTIYQTASAGKQFTAALILLLAERGYLAR